MKLLSAVAWVVLGLLVLFHTAQGQTIPCCGEPTVNCLVDPCSTIRPGTCAKGCVSSYCGGCKALCKCDSDTDCKFGQFCLFTGPNSPKVCKAYSYTGETCGGFVVPGCQSKCAPGYQCVLNPQVIDAPGACYRDCEKGKCPCGNAFCKNNACLPKGRCVTASDCRNSVGLPRPGCSWTCSRANTGIGKPGRCVLQCTAPVRRP